MQLYLSLVPVEAVVFVVGEGSLVALMLGEFGSFVENLLGLENIAGHTLNHLAHSVSQHLPDLHTHTQTQCSHIEVCNVRAAMVKAQFVNLPDKSDFHGMPETSSTEDLKHTTTVKTAEGFVSLYLEVGADLHQ